PLLIEQPGQKPESTQVQSSRLPYLPLQTAASPPDNVSTRPFMLELSHLQTHRPPTTSQPARLASIPLRNTTRLRHLLPPHPSPSHLDTFNTHPPKIGRASCRERV